MEMFSFKYASYNKNLIYISKHSINRCFTVISSSSSILRAAISPILYGVDTVPSIEGLGFAGGVLRFVWLLTTTELDLLANSALQT